MPQGHRLANISYNQQPCTRPTEKSFERSGFEKRRAILDWNVGGTGALPAQPYALRQLCRQQLCYSNVLDLLFIQRLEPISRYSGPVDLHDVRKALQKYNEQTGGARRHAAMLPLCATSNSTPLDTSVDLPWSPARSFRTRSIFKTKHYEQSGLD